MFGTAIVAFREFLEVFLIIGIFLGVSKKMQLNKELEITLAAGTGIIISFILVTTTYFFGDYARSILTEKNADLLESYLLIFSGFFIAYVIFSLHKTISHQKNAMIKNTKIKLQQEVFDITLFLTIIFLIVREGFEIALFSATISLFSPFIQNIIGLLVAFFISSIFGLATFFAYVRLPIGKVFKITEYGIILVGASLLQNGITKLLLLHYNINLSNMLSFHLHFLPSEHTIVGNFFQSFFGIDNGFSMTRLLIMIGYITVTYFLFLRMKTDKK